MKRNLWLRCLSLVTSWGLIFPIMVWAASSSTQSPTTPPSGPVVNQRSVKHQFEPGVLIFKTSATFYKNFGNVLHSASEHRPNPIQNLLTQYQADQIQPLFPLLKSQPDTSASGFARIYLARFPAVFDPLKIAQKLQATGWVEYAEPRYWRFINYVPNDSLYAEQWHLRLIKAEKAWDIQRGNKQVLIAIVDTGIDWKHPDLAAQIWTNTGEIPGNGIDDDQNGYIDDVHGWDFGENDNSTMNTSSNLNAAHGSMTAGVAAATTNNRQGIASIGFDCTLMPVKCSLDYAKDPQQLIRAGFEGIKYAVDNGADIVSCSWSGESASDYEMEIIRYAHTRGVAVIAAAGNGYSDVAQYPAAYPYVFSVAATNDRDQKATFSNYNRTVELAAPGVDILTTWGNTQGYVWMDGTSFATPLVAGTVALVKSQFPDWTGEQAAHQVRVTADDIYYVNLAYLNKLGKGRVNAFRALTETLPALKIETTRNRDTAGNNDGIIDPNESIDLWLTLMNYLETATNARLTLLTEDPYVKLITYQITVPAIATGKSVTTENQPFRFTTTADVPRSHRVDFTVEIEADGGYSDRDYFSLVIAPAFATHNVGNVALTVSSFGVFGYNDYALSQQPVGEGFQYPKGSVSALFHGTLLVGVQPDQVSDCAYGNASKNQYDWATTELGNLVLGQTQLSDQDSYAQYRDKGATKPIGVTVTQRGFAWKQAPDEAYVVLEFEVQNTTAPPISNLYVGLYLDWDIGKVNDNLVGYNAEHGVGFQSAPNSKYYGLALLAPARPASYRAVRNEFYVWPDSYSDELKWQFMTEGFQVTKSDVPHDWSQLLSAGPFILDKYEKIKVAYAMLGGETETDLIQNALAAQIKYRQLTAVQALPMAKMPPSQPVLTPNFPNPFNSATTIQYRIPGAGSVSLQLFDIQGAFVRTLVDRSHPPGQYTVQWDGRNARGELAPSGVYWVRFKWNDFINSQKLILIR